MDDRLSYRPQQVDPSAWLAPNCTVLGDVTIGAESSVWFGAVVRADTDPVRIGRRTNVQDLCLLHADPGFPCTVGDDVTIGHAAIVHGATVADRVMIGMRAVVLNGAQIGEHAVIGAGAVVTEGMVVPPGSLVLGVPGKVRRDVTPEEIQRIEQAARHYVTQSQALRAAAKRGADQRS
jgi:carbonic anhydrase/acetyltransferase-like protein (isoleucine patch superfamily)